MGRPQDNRLQRSGNTPLDPNYIETEVQTQPHAPRDEPGGGPIPPEQQPGHHPGVDQDKPDLDAFAEKLGIEPDADQPDADQPDADQPDGDGSDRDHGHGPLDAVRAVATTAKGFAEPVAHLVSDGVSRVAQAIDDLRSLSARVDRLEAQVAELTERLDEDRSTT
jgi:hypothetical protein